MDGHSDTLDIYIIPVSQVDPSQFPFWNLVPPPINLELSQYTKANTPPLVYYRKYLEIKANYEYYEPIYTDGLKHEDKAAAAVYAEGQTYSCRLSNT